MNGVKIKMKITLVEKLIDSKNRKFVTEGTSVESFQDLEQESLYSARLVREDQRDVWIQVQSPHQIQAYAKSFNLQEVYVCEIKRREDSETDKTERVRVPIPGNQTTSHSLNYGLNKNICGV